MDLWTSPSDRREPFGPCGRDRGQRIRVAHRLAHTLAQRYPAQFAYWFNRRFDLPAIIPRLVCVALRTPPMPERLLNLRLA